MNKKSVTFEERRARRKALYDEWKASGLSVRLFSRQRGGAHASTLYKSIAEFGDKDDKPSSLPTKEEIAERLRHLKPKRSPLTEAEKIAVVEDWRKSGMTRAAYSKERLGLGSASLERWVRQAEGRERRHTKQTKAAVVRRAEPVNNGAIDVHPVGPRPRLICPCCGEDVLAALERIGTAVQAALNISNHIK